MNTVPVPVPFPAWVKTIEVYVSTLAKVHRTGTGTGPLHTDPTWVKTIEVQHTDHTEKRVNINVTFYTWKPMVNGIEKPNIL